LQKAKWAQALLNAGKKGDKEAAQIAEKESFRALECMWKVFSFEKEKEETDFVGDLSKNTPDRIQAFMAYDAMLGFRTYRLEKNPNPCDYKAENK
jgi:hypothetical protein